MTSQQQALLCEHHTNISESSVLMGLVDLFLHIFYYIV